jgi:uncharacterized membrane protein HdeD (DUF308 family)
MLLLRGLVAIAFGVLTWLQPGISLATLVLFFGLFALVDGALAVAAAITGRTDDEDWWVMLLGGLLGMGVGTLTLLAPEITALALLFYIAIWAIATGVLQIAAAIKLRKEVKGEWIYILGGIASVLFGAMLAMRPGVGALAVLWLIGTYAVIFGVLMVILAFKVRRIGRQLAAA